MSVSTHVLDSTTGVPAAGVPVQLDQQVDLQWMSVATANTDMDGRVGALHPGDCEPGVYRLVFALADYFGDTPHFYPEVTINFRVTEPGAHYHVPLLLSPFAYATYRGS